MEKIKSLMKKTSEFIAPMKNKIMALAMFCLIGASAFAEGESADTGDVGTLWGKLDIDIADFFQKVFATLSSPVGVVLAVIFVMAIFYFVIKLARRSITPSNRV